MRHHLQKSILDHLGSAESLRYADINTDKLDGNVFTYHLKQVIADKLVIQNPDKTYSLTSLGKTYLVHRYEDQSRQAHSIFLVVVRHGNKLLLRKRLVQPMIGYSGFVHGEPVMSEDLAQTVARRVTLKTGIHLHDIAIHSSGLIQITSGDTYNSFSHAVIVSAIAPSLDLPITQDETGENYWIDEADLPTVENLLPSCTAILEGIKTPLPWFQVHYDA